jgi:hypothetical protein
MFGRHITARFLTAALLMLALLVSGMLPKGFMPGQNADRMVSIVLCKSTGMTTIDVKASDLPGQIAQSEKSQGNHHDQQAGNDCPFAITGPLALTPLPVIASALFTQEPPATAPPERPRTDTSKHIYFAQGPPALFA